MKQRETLLRRSKLQMILEENRDMEVSVAIVARGFAVATRILKYDIGWLRLNRAMRIESKAPGTVTFTGYDEKAFTAESVRGRISPLVGACDFCGKNFILTGHQRFCTSSCQEEYSKLDPHKRQMHEANLVLALLAGPQTQERRVEFQAVEETSRGAFAYGTAATSKLVKSENDPVEEGDLKPDQPLLDEPLKETDLDIEI